MHIDPMLALVVILIFVVVLSSYSARDKKGKILCSFTRRDRTKILKWVKISQARVEFDGGWYHVEPSRTVQRLWESGIHFIIPIWVRCSDYRFDSSRPLNPDTFDNQFTPEERKQLDKSDDIRALQQGNQQSLNAKSGKQGILQQYLPIIVLVGFILCGWMLWQQQKKIDLVGYSINVVQEQNAIILKK